MAKWTVDHPEKPPIPSQSLSVGDQSNGVQLRAMTSDKGTTMLMTVSVTKYMPDQPAAILCETWPKEAIAEARDWLDKLEAEL